MKKGERDTSAATSDPRYKSIIHCYYTKDKNSDKDSETVSTLDSENTVVTKRGSMITIFGRAESNFVAQGSTKRFHGVTYCK